MADKHSFLVIKYPRPDTAMEALAALKQLSKEKVVKLKDAVAITKTARGKIKLHQTKDDSAGKGFLKGGLIGVVFAALFGPVGWVAAGALAGGAFAMFDRGVKNKVLKALGEEMSSDESAVAILVEEADWPQAIERMKAHNFHGEVVVMQIVEEDLAEVEKLLEAEKTVAAPDELELEAPPAEAAVERLAVAAVAMEAAVESAPESELAEAERLAVAAVAVEAATESAAEPEQVEVVVPEATEARRSKGLEYIEGVGEVYSRKLVDAGISSVEALLEKGATPKGRDDLAEATGISHKLILRWVNMADLFRIKGVGQEYAELLEAAGVDTVPELARRVPANLLEKLEAANEHHKMVRRLPVLSQVESWVEQAASLARIITY